MWTDAYDKDASVDHPQLALIQFKYCEVEFLLNSYH